MTAASALCGSAALNAALSLAAWNRRLDLHDRDSGSRTAWTLALCAGTIAQAGILYYVGGHAWPGLLVCLSCVVVCAVSDGFTGYVFDVVSLPSLAAILASAAWRHTAGTALMGTLTCGGLLLLLHLVTRGRGLGLGDVKLAGCIGAALGTNDGVMSLGVAFVAGGAYAIVLLARRRASRGDSIRFAPFLAAGVAMLSIGEAVR